MPLGPPVVLAPPTSLPPPPPPLLWSVLLAKAKEAEDQNLTSSDIRVRIARAMKARLTKKMIPPPPLPHGQSLPSRPTPVPYSVLLAKAAEASKKNTNSGMIEVNIVEAMRAKFTKKVTKIVPRQLGPVPIGELPEPPSPIPYAELVRKANLCTKENKISEDIRVKIV